MSSSSNACPLCAPQIAIVHVQVVVSLATNPCVILQQDSPIISGIPSEQCGCSDYGPGVSTVCHMEECTACDKTLPRRDQPTSVGAVRWSRTDRLALP